MGLTGLERQWTEWRRTGESHVNDRLLTRAVQRHLYPVCSSPHHGFNVRCFGLVRLAVTITHILLGCSHGGVVSPCPCIPRFQVATSSWVRIGICNTHVTHKNSTLTGRLEICLVEKLLRWASRMLETRSWDEAGDCIMWSLRDSDLGQISKDLTVLWKVTMLNTLVAVYFCGFLAWLWSPDIWSSILSISVVLLLGETNVCLRKYGKPPVIWMEQNGTKGWPPQSKRELCRSTAFTRELWYQLLPETPDYICLVKF